METRLRAPTRARDTLTLTAEVTELRDTRRADRGLAVIARTLHNQREELVQRITGTTLIRRAQR
ncbi:MAG TPA: hypothetical protein VHX88_18470 [Solirubrobacteraceae bacterium]|jgi:acyl dehydratase|nr:hypothetical protein [Solirubrobacteraceae bacterium]